jgi:hypothetical protein
MKQVFIWQVLFVNCTCHVCTSELQIYRLERELTSPRSCKCTEISYFELDLENSTFKVRYKNGIS